ncbi:nucleotidyl transferase AbiEii/AbiGii toxin family protein [Skermania sp. ID1734]|uniref:nucleotidyl transferase AbiEii/AbiGii toxin family protein n=1 Tax=Skermania sp. ID1734 TaxID=2597516 RepID=UPI00117C8520|nr:nucleotidyl transferase AbiEii/AbiGii toxin family protein [Skermania sp. ID1734]TSE00733.1 nucleotidyl transferase AbiEii/AbiGii toxin family protein [Skermania sp. ID1734]
MPPPNIASLRARLRNRARDVRQVETRVQRRLAALVLNEIFLGADLGTDGPPVLIKGGTAIDLRRGTAPARLSKDLDVAVRGNVDRFVAQARGLLDAGWGGFTGRLTRETEINIPGLLIKPRRFEVKLDYLGKPFATVPVEVGQAEGNSGDEHDRITVDEYDTIGLAPRGPVYCLSLRYQIAQKIHACTDPLDGVIENDRARDLIDLQLLTLVVNDDELASIRTACVEIFTSRQRHSWPPTIRIWPAWPALYAAAASRLGNDVVPDVHRAADWLQTLIEAIDISAQ